MNKIIFSLTVKGIKYTSYPRLKQGILISFLLLSKIVLSAQTLPISAVTIQGNTKTRTTYLQHFISSSKGELSDSAILQNDLRKLRSLPGIMDVAYTMDTVDVDSVQLTFTVKERYTLLPVGDFGITSGNFWIGAGAMESNLAGRGLYLYGYYRYNSDNTIHIIFRNPYLFGSRWGFETQLKNFPTSDVLTDSTGWDNDYFDANLAVKFERKYEEDYFLGLSYRYQYSQFVSNKTAENSINTSYLRSALGFFFKLNTRRLDHHDFYVSGWRNQLKAESLFPFASNDKITYFVYNDIRYYLRIRQKGNLAARLGIGLSNETIDPFSPFITDSYQNIRGIGYRAQFGNTIGILNLEYRQTVFENKGGGIQMVVFTDLGNLKPGNISHKDWDYANNLQAFSGVGIRLIYKKIYNAIFSIDVGVNMNNIEQAGWVIGMGQYF